MMTLTSVMLTKHTMLRPENTITLPRKPRDYDVTHEHIPEQIRFEQSSTGAFACWNRKHP